MSQISLQLLFCYVLLCIVGGVGGTPRELKKPEMRGDLPVAINIEDYLDFLRLKALESELLDEKDEEDIDKRARFRPRLGKRSAQFRARLGRFMIIGSKLC